MGGKPAAARLTSDNTDALSLHTTPDDYDYDALPSYTDSENAATSSSAEQAPIDPPTYTEHNTPEDEYSPVPDTHPRWIVVASKIVNQGEVSTRIDKRLDDPSNLYTYIMHCVRLIPPKPMVRLAGHHYEETRDSKNKKSTQTVVDFDVRITLQSMLRGALEKDWWAEKTVHNDDKAYRGSIYRTRAAGHTQGVQLSDEPVPDLKEWCHRYCASPSKLKVFRITREVHGLHTATLEPLLISMIRGTDYRGRLEITFPIDNKHVDIYNSRLVNRWRHSWVRFVFYLSMLWIFTWPILFFMTRWYTVYKVIWNFSVPVETTNERRHATLSEVEWFNLNKNYIRHLVLNKFQGEVDMRPDVVSEYNNPPPPTRATSGNENIDSALHIIQSGVNVWNQLSHGQQRSPGAWGYDR